MRNKFESITINMLEVCRMLCDYGKLLNLDFIIFEMFSYSTIKLDYSDINEIVIIDDKYVQIKTSFGDTFITIEDIALIEIE